MTMHREELVSGADSLDLDVPEVDASTPKNERYLLDLHGRKIFPLAKHAPKRSGP